MIKTLAASALVLNITSAHALVYSSSLKFKLTDTRINPKDFNHIPVLNEKTIPSAIKDPVVAALEKKQSPSWQPEKEHAFDPYQLKGKLPSKHPHEARIFAVDEEALLNGKIQPIAGAAVYMISPSLEKAPLIKTSGDGVAKIPYPFSQSLRFFVQAKGYMMGMGYASFGDLTFVPMVSEKRFSVLAKSLSLSIPAGQLAVLGRLVDQNYKGIEGSQIKFQSSNPEIVYSGPFFGGIPGYFTEEFKETDKAAAFLINGVSRSKHTLEIHHANKTIPDFTYDFSGIPESIRFVSLALQDGPSINLNSEVVDGESFERPSCGLVAKLPSKNEKPGVPEEDGSTWLETKRRPLPTEVNIITSKCGDYVPTHFTQPANESLFPPTVGLFTLGQIQETLSVLNRDWSPVETLVLGHIYPQKDFKHELIKEVSLTIYSSDGQRVPAEIFYFDQENNLDPRRVVTDPHHQNFIVLGLEDGEYHFAYRNGSKGHGLGIQVVRVKRGTITQVDF